MVDQIFDWCWNHLKLLGIFTGFCIALSFVLCRVHSRYALIPMAPVPVIGSWWLTLCYHKWEKWANEQKRKRLLDMLVADLNRVERKQLLPHK